MPKKMDVWERFMRLVSPEPNSGCWLWDSNTMPSGYGYFGLAAGKHVRAHRFAYEMMRGPIPEGMVLDHLCRMKCCVNPDHLEVVTPAENYRRAKPYLARGTNNFSGRKTECPRGHPYSPENTYNFTNSRGGPHRVCKTCQRMRYRARRAAMLDKLPVLG